MVNWSGLDLLYRVFNRAKVRIRKPQWSDKSINERTPSLFSWNRTETSESMFHYRLAIQSSSSAELVHKHYHSHAWCIWGFLQAQQHIHSTLKDASNISKGINCKKNSMCIFSVESLPQYTKKIYMLFSYSYKHLLEKREHAKYSALLANILKTCNNWRHDFAVWVEGGIFDC